MGVKKPEQACTLRQFEEETKVIPLQPAVKGPIANSLEGKQHPQGNDFTRVEIGLAVLGHVFHRIANLAEQINEIIFSGLEVSPFAVGLATYSLENLETFFNKNQWSEIHVSLSATDILNEIFISKSISPAIHLQ